MLGVAKHWQCFVDQPPYHSHEKVVATDSFFDQAVAVHSLVCDLGEVNCTPSRHKGMSSGDLASQFHHHHGGHRCSLLIQNCHLQVSLTPPSLLQRCGLTLSLLKTDLGIRAVISLIPVPLTDSLFLFLSGEPHGHY